MKFSIYSSLLILIFFGQNKSPDYEYIHGAITRADTNQKEIALVFTGDEYADGAEKIIDVLDQHEVQASFFFTGRFYRNPDYKSSIENLVRKGHYLGAHSNDHLLYCDWDDRDSLLVTKHEFIEDLKSNYREMKRFGINKKDAYYFLPPYEWYNDSIAIWTNGQELQLINHTHGTLSHADYTTPDMKNYRTSSEIFKSILDYEKADDAGLNGFILLIHIGTAPARTDKFYHYLDPLIVELKDLGYDFTCINNLLNEKKN